MGVINHWSINWQSGHTALNYAAEQGHFRCMSLLMEYGADKDIKANVRIQNFSSAIFGRGSYIFLEIKKVMITFNFRIKI